MAAIPATWTFQKGWREVRTLLLIESGKRCDSGLMTGVSQGNSVANPAHPALARAAHARTDLTTSMKYFKPQGARPYTCETIPLKHILGTQRASEAQQAEHTISLRLQVLWLQHPALMSKAVVGKQACTSASQGFLPEWSKGAYGSQRTASVQPR